MAREQLGADHGSRAQFSIMDKSRVSLGEKMAREPPQEKPGRPSRSICCLGSNSDMSAEVLPRSPLSVHARLQKEKEKFDLRQCCADGPFFPFSYK